MNLIARAIQKPGVDEHHSIAHRADAFGKIHAGAPLLVHDADLERVPGEPEQCLHLGKELCGEGGFLGAVHLGLDDVHRVRA